jgi:catechol 2,3-dioxygenase-like lactoylglutathione lyase family enzyme
MYTSRDRAISPNKPSHYIDRLHTMSSTFSPNGFKLNHVGLCVADIDKSVTFYTQVFGMKELFHMSLDAATIAFVGYASPENAEIPVWAREGVLELVAPEGEFGEDPILRTVLAKLRH